MDNNSAEQSIRGFCVGKKNWVMIDTIAGANSSAMIYSIAETAKANNLRPYNYFEYLLTEILKHMDDQDTSFCENLLPGLIICQRIAKSNFKTMPLFGTANHKTVPTMVRLRIFQLIHDF